jgi:CheY-like chemotaxis protein
MKMEKKNILVVDDEADIRLFLKTALEDAGFEVSTASDGEEALQALKKRKPDLISLDLVMPRKSGIKFLYELRHNKEWAKIPVIIVTGHARDESVKKEMDETFAGKTLSGPQVYLEKPVKAQDFVNMVKRELGVADTSSSSEEDLRNELLKMVEKSDSQTLKEILAMLKGKSR